MQAYDSGLKAPQRRKERGSIWPQKPRPLQQYFPGQSSCLQHQDLGTCQTLFHGKCSCIFRKLGSSHRLSEDLPEDPAKASSPTVCMFLSASVPLVPLHVSSTQSRPVWVTSVLKTATHLEASRKPTERVKEWKQSRGSEGETVQHQTIEKGRN